MLQVAIIEAKGYGRRDNVGKIFDMKAPGFIKPSTKVSHVNGFAKFDYVEITKREEKWKEIINCFDKTAAGKPRKLHMEYFAPKEKDPRKSGNITEIRLLQKRDGYSYNITSAACSVA